MAGASSGRNYSFKVVLLGEGCVGKTSLVLRYIENKFNDKHSTTLQVSLHNMCRITVMLLIFPLNLKIVQYTSTACQAISNWANRPHLQLS